MIDDEIKKLKNKLNLAIEQEKPYEEIYQISVQLDKLIAEYYNEKMKDKN